MIRRVLALTLAVALPAFAQDDGVIEAPAEGSASAAIPDVRAGDIRTVKASGAKLRGLDRMSGEVTELDLAVGETAEVGRIEVTLGECRYPEDNPAGEAFAWLTIRDPVRNSSFFDGWMIASSPALNALDHPRYDVWVIRCTTS